MILYMAVTNDEYELPCVIAESSSKLARMLGVTQASVCHRIKNGEKIPIGSPRIYTHRNKHRIRTVEVEEDDFAE